MESNTCSQLQSYDHQSYDHQSYDQLNKILDTPFCIYNYTTVDYQSGTIVINKDLSAIMDKQTLFDMNNVSVKSVTIRELLETGFVGVGSVDLMDTIKITYPSSSWITANQNVYKQTPKIEGKYLHGSRKKLIIDPTGIDFELDPYDSNEDPNDESLCDL